ncbi:putative transporter of the NRAMP family [Fistulina hepatica ATCC 64428]|uniref:Putative transporter of the NRAMP family n=1 Tax=Fistulina hepatica ATCC 64428 TaxID=1128425 RepID=A0A0D7APD4_9AGAR|nr:putative transporter of the NRAMP family [Fistulina hepatica ATCC 64428]
MRICKIVVEHARRHTGVGVICAVAYFDPGNWSVDLDAGSQYGYRMLFVVLISGIIAVYLQVRLDLATHCRLLLHDRPKHKYLYRWFLLYPLYIISEVAIIATDLAELLGTAVALILLFPRLKIWHGVLITAFDVVILLALRDPLHGRPVRVFEVAVAIMVLVVMICLVVIIAQVKMDWAEAFLGFLPSKYLVKSGALYISVGILGATVMPHSLFLGSALATQDRLAMKSNNSLSFIRAHMYHGMVDVAGSLLGFAVLINSLILMIASAIFYYGPYKSVTSASLFDAYDIICDYMGRATATLFAIALLSSGQSASLIATIAGQAVAEGFIHWRVSLVMRRLITRLIAIVPSMAVAFLVGRTGIDTLLVLSQVVLSLCLPFAAFPLILLTSSRTVMCVKRSIGDSEVGDAGTDDNESAGMVYFNNNLFMTLLGALIFLLVVAANVYVIAALALGEG